MLVSNIPMTIYFSLIHQRGSLTIMSELRTVSQLAIRYNRSQLKYHFVWKAIDDYPGPPSHSMSCYTLLQVDTLACSNNFITDNLYSLFSHRNVSMRFLTFSKLYVFSSCMWLCSLLCDAFILLVAIEGRKVLSESSSVAKRLLLQSSRVANSLCHI